MTDLSRQHVAPRKKAYVALSWVQVLFGIWPVMATIAMREVEPMALAGIRVVAAAPLVVLLARLRTPLGVPMRELLRFALLGFLGVTFNQLMFVEGLLRTGPTEAVAWIVSIPATTLLVGTILGFEKPNARKKVGVLLSIVGVWILVGLGHDTFSVARISGYAFLLANSTSYAFYLVLARPAVQRHGPIIVMAWVLIFGALLGLPVTVGPMMDTPWNELSTPVAWTLVFAVIGPTIATYFLNAYALTRLDSSIVAVFICIQPFVGWVAGHVLIHEAVTLRTVVAGVVMMVGVALTSISKREHAAATEATT